MLEGPRHAVGMAEVVDGRAARPQPGLQRRDDRVAQCRDLRALEQAGSIFTNGDEPGVKLRTQTLNATA